MDGVLIDRFCAVILGRHRFKVHDSLNALTRQPHHYRSEMLFALTSIAVRRVH